jgi:hypothetical protein
VPQLASAANAYVARWGGVVRSTANKSLTLDAPPAPISGADALGAYTGFALSFNANTFAAAFRVYAARDAIVFAQSFPSGLSGMAGGDAGGLSTAFPVFGPPRDALADATTGYVTWSGGMSTGVTGVWTAKGAAAGRFGSDSGPIALFNESRAFVLSPADNFMTANLNFCELTDMALGAGLGGMVDEVPAGWTVETILVAGGEGVTRTMLSWGDALLVRGGKTRTASDADIAVSTLGYWTDNGAYYYYLSENNSIRGNMQQTIVDVLAYGKSLGLPYKHLMYDSWWYWKECGGESANSWLTCKGAVENWVPRDDVFPSGFAFKPDNLPLVLHNRWFSAINNTYIKNGFKDSFIAEPNVDFALPIKADVFVYLMAKAKAWGMQVYEQDWLITVCV